MTKEFITFEGKKVKFTGEVRRPGTNEMYQYADGSINRAVTVKNSYPILEFINEMNNAPLNNPDSDPNDFYMVQFDNTLPTSKRHYCEETAISEATRLARNNPGKKFYLLQTVGFYEVAKPDPEFTKVERK